MRSETKKHATSRGAVITFDVIKSRERTNVALTVQKAIQRINKRYWSQLLAPFVVTLGDEFQGVLKEHSLAFEVFLEIQTTLPIYAGLGIGKIDEGNENYAPRMTGEAFVLSRESLNFAKKYNHTFFASTDNRKITIAVNALAFASQFIRSEQTERQKFVVDRLTVEPELSKKKLAHELRITAASVSSILSGGGFPALEQIRNAIRAILSEGDFAS
jgi:hypothetical protein